LRQFVSSTDGSEHNCPVDILRDASTPFPSCGTNGGAGGLAIGTGSAANGGNGGLVQGMAAMVGQR